MYIFSLAVLNRVASVCAIIDDTGIYCHQRQFMQTTIYADDNLCNIYCRRRQFMQATIYAVTIPVSSAGFTSYAPGIGFFLSYMVSSPLGRIQSILAIHMSHGFVLPGTHQL